MPACGTRFPGIWKQRSSTSGRPGASLPDWPVWQRPRRGQDGHRLVQTEWGKRLKGTEQRSESRHEGPMRFWGLALVLAEIAQRLERERQTGQQDGTAQLPATRELAGADQQ